MTNDSPSLDSADAAPDRDRTHFLLVGDSADLPRLQAILYRLPVDAYGQVFIEVSDDAHRERWDRYGEVSVTWLVRERGGRAVAPGALAANAVMAWIAEWMPEEPEAHGAPYVMWIGCSASTVMDRLYIHLGNRLEHLHLHRPH